MVAQEEITPQSDNTGAFGKLKQTLSSSLLTAQDKGNIFYEIFFFNFRIKEYVIDIIVLVYAIYYPIV